MRASLTTLVRSLDKHQQIRLGTPGILGRRALPAGRIAALGATMELHHGRAQLVHHDRPSSHGSPQPTPSVRFTQRRGRAGRQRPCERADARRDRKSSAAILHIDFALRDPWPLY
jgi:hypothetical protein